MGEDKVDLMELQDATHIILSLPWDDEEKEKTYGALGFWVNRHF